MFHNQLGMSSGSES